MVGRVGAQVVRVGGPVQVLDVAGVAGQGEGEGEGAAAAVGGGVAAAAAGAALLLQQVDLAEREGGNLKIMICYFF